MRAAVSRGRGHGPTPARRLEALRRTMSGAQQPLILIYGNPDPDALGSAWALRKLLQGDLPPPAIAYTGRIGRPENETMVEILGIPAEPLAPEALARADRVALVDAQPGFFRQLDLPRCDVVLDHHPRRGGRGVSFSDIRPKCLATCSILTEYLREAGVGVDRRLATALYYGIQTDGRNRLRAPDPTDTAAVGFLDRLVNRDLLRRIEFSSYTLQGLDYFSIALIRLRHSHNAFYTHVGPVPSADICAQIADFLIRVREANWALVSGVAGTRLVIVFRCDGHQKNAGRVAEAAFGELGSAGGHRTIGRAEIEQSALGDAVLLTSNEQVQLFILNALAKVERGFRPLLHSVQPRDPRQTAARRHDRGRGVRPGTS